MPIVSADAGGTLHHLRGASNRGRAGRSPTGVGMRTAAAGTVLAALLAGCARDGEPRTFAVPAAAAARIRMVCPPGSFVGTMTANCPQILPAAR